LAAFLKAKQPLKQPGNAAFAAQNGHVFESKTAAKTAQNGRVCSPKQPLKQRGLAAFPGQNGSQNSTDWPRLQPKMAGKIAQK